MEKLPRQGTGAGNSPFFYFISTREDLVVPSVVVGKPDPWPFPLPRRTPNAPLMEMLKCLCNDPQFRWAFLSVKSFKMQWNPSLNGKKSSLDIESIGPWY